MNILVLYVNFLFALANKRCCAVAVKDGRIVRATLVLVKITTVRQSVWINRQIGAAIRGRRRGATSPNPKHIPGCRPGVNTTADQ